LPFRATMSGTVKAFGPVVAGFASVLMSRLPALTLLRRTIQLVRPCGSSFF
jgi:hypothetical protein